MKVAVGAMETGKEEGRAEEEVVRDLDSMELWRGENIVNQLLVETFQRWTRIQQEQQT
jgi:hypothetical protein